MAWKWVTGAVLAAALLAVLSPVAAADTRPRLIVLTDIGNEPDDAESMVRLLLYANDFAIEGLVASTSRHLPRNPRRELIGERIAAYGRTLANLRVHDRRYPAAAALAAVVRSGSPVYGMRGVGKGKDTPASRLIIAAVDRPDPRPVWIAVWGGVHVVPETRDDGAPQQVRYRRAILTVPGTGFGRKAACAVTPSGPTH